MRRLAAACSRALPYLVTATAVAEADRFVDVQGLVWPLIGLAVTALVIQSAYVKWRKATP